MIHRLLVPLFAFACIASALNVSADAVGDATTHTVVAENFEWTPQTLGVSAGDSVTFVDADGAHNWVSDAGMGSCELPCTRTFPEEGTFAYHCGIHPSMTGEIVVGAPPAVAFVLPAEGATLSGLVQVVVEADHPTLPISSVEVGFVEGAMVAATPEGAGRWVADVDTLPVANGPGALVARASAGGFVGEATREVVVANPEFVDLELRDLRATTDGATRSTLTFRLANAGNVAAPTTRVVAEYAHDGEWRHVGSMDAPAVPARASRTLTLHWDNPGAHVGAFDVRVTADPLDVVAERDESNNAAATVAAFVTPLLPGVDLLDP